MSTGADNAADRAIRVRLWDLPTRLFHWLIVGLVAFSWFTAETDRLTWHRWSGYTILGLLVFRLVWGFVGGSTARFASFVKGPAAVLRYVRDLGRPGYAALPGHNPLGGWSVVAMLLLLVNQVAMGLFVVDDDTGFEGGPLSGYVSYERGLELGEWHELMFNVILALTALHVAAVLFYLVFRRDNLIGAMFTGRRLMASEPAAIRFAPWWTALVAAILAAGVAHFIVSWIPKLWPPQ